jgi:hypothetical protein
MLRKLPLPLLTVIAGLAMTSLSQAYITNSFVFVPLPCPNEEAWQKAQIAMDGFCEKAAAQHYTVIIVRSCYNDSANLQRSKDGNWWWDEILDLPKHYSTYIKQGVVRIVDTVSHLSLEYTPAGFFFDKDGDITWKGQLNDW